ncbi:hypothetical protein NDU88_006144 [Pleurodeles waltl]|uniref:Uncharacterized protein n=1 Tax=Pleurodeles waltl TaxID=8319 RepID=A0AAV7PK88_PLEWA|nr:hypothetical protein NDU88_006144 [Pleurodeles waltl]
MIQESEKRTGRTPGAPSGTEKLTQKYSAQLQAIEIGQTQKQEGFLNPKRTHQREACFLPEEMTHTERSARRAEPRRRRQEEDDAVQRGRPTLEKNRREVQEARRSEQTGLALGRAWPSQIQSKLTMGTGNNGHVGFNMY